MDHNSLREFTLRHLLRRRIVDMSDGEVDSAEQDSDEDVRGVILVHLTCGLMLEQDSDERARVLALLDLLGFDSDERARMIGLPMHLLFRRIVDCHMSDGQVASEEQDSDERAGILALLQLLFGRIADKPMSDGQVANEEQDSDERAGILALLQLLFGRIADKPMSEGQVASAEQDSDECAGMLALLHLLFRRFVDVHMSDGQVASAEQDSDERAGVLALLHLLSGRIADRPMSDGQVASAEQDSDKDVKTDSEPYNDEGVQVLIIDSDSDGGAVNVRVASANSEAENVHDILELCENDVVQGLTELHLAAERGDTEAVRSLLMSSSNVYTLDAEHNTSLHYASRNGHVDVVNLLLSKKTIVYSRKAFVRTSLHPEAMRGHVYTLDTEHNTPLHYGSQNGHVDVVNLLLSKKTTVYSRKAFVRTSFHPEAMHGHAGIVENLIINGATVNACNKEKMTPLHLACKNGHTSIVEILLNNHATVDVMKQSEETPFYLAAKNGHAHVTDLLLSRGVCDFVLTDDKQTPLHAAVKESHTEVVEVILNHCRRISRKYRPTVIGGQKLQGNDNNLAETSGIQPIQLFRSDGRLVSAGLVWTEINEPLEMWTNKEKQTALDLAIVSTQPKMVQLLLGADQCSYSEKHLRNSCGCLIEAIGDYKVANSGKKQETDRVRSDNEQYEIFCENVNEIAQILINSIKFNVNHQDENGETLIHEVLNKIGCAHSEPDRMIQLIDFMQLLLENGADFNLKSSNGETPLMIASEKCCYDAIEILFDWEQISGMKLELDARDKYGETALIKAVDRDYVSVMRLLLNHKASVNLHDYYGFTVLHAVVYEPNTNWIDFYFFCEVLRTFDGVDSPKNRTIHKFKLEGNTVNSKTIIDRLQRHLHDNEGAIRLREEVVKLLLEHNTPLHYASQNGHVDVDNLLLSKKTIVYSRKAFVRTSHEETNVNAVDFRGNTPLDLALKSSKRINSPICKALKNRGAIQTLSEPEDDAPIEVARVDKRGRNPLHRLIISRTSSCQVLYLSPDTASAQDEIQYDFTVSAILLNPMKFRELAKATDKKGRTPLHYAAILPSLYSVCQCRDPISVLLAIGFEVNAADIYRKTPLHYAEESVRYDLLKNFGADENTKDKYGYTPKDLKRLRDLVITHEKNAKKRPDLNLTVDISQVINTNHVTDLTRRKQVETIKIYSQSPGPGESEEAGPKNEFFLLNKRLSQLKPFVEKFIERLVAGIKKRDWRFECQPNLVGSAMEETKAVLSGDFDLNFKLIQFARFCTPLSHPLGPNGYFQLRRKSKVETESRRDEKFDSFFNTDHYLLTDEVNSRFHIVLEEVLSDAAFWEDEELFDWNTTHKYEKRYGNHSGLCETLLLRMIHPIEDGEGDFLFFRISFDIVACVQVEDWWPEDPLPVGIDPAVKKDGCTFVFDRPRFDPSKPRGAHLIFSETFARISFAPLESRIIKDSSPLMKAAYTICKKILHKVFKITYQLKTSLLFCMEAFNARRGIETRNDDEITPKQLNFWVERIMFCFMEFSRCGIYPCYFMPSFKQLPLYLPDPHRQCLRRKADTNDSDPKDLMDFRYCAIYGNYLDLCPDGSTFDIPTEALIEHHEQSIHDRSTLDPNGDSLLKHFDREEFIRLLASRGSI